MGAYPQLLELGHDLGGRTDEPEEERSAESVAGEEEVEEATTRAATSVATAKRRLQFYILTNGGLPE